MFPGLFWMKCVWAAAFSHRCTNNTLLPHTLSSKTRASIGLSLSEIHGKYKMFCVSSEGMVMERMFATPEHCGCNFSWIRAHRVYFRQIFSCDWYKDVFFWKVGGPGSMRRIHRAAMMLIPSSLPCDCHSQMVASILCLHLILSLQHKNSELSSILFKLIKAKHPSCRLYHKLWLVQMNVSIKITWESLLQMLKCFVQKGSNFTY